MCGFVCPGHWRNNTRERYNIMQIGGNEEMPFALSEFREGHINLRGWWFDPEAIEFGIRATSDAAQCKLVIMDEIGLLDIEGHLWSGSLTRLLSEGMPPVLITVRDKFVNKVSDHWQLRNLHIFDTANITAGQMAESILTTL